MLPGEADEEVVEGRGYFDRDGAEVQTGAARCQLDLVAGEGDDAAELLAVDQDQGAADPVPQLQALVVEETAGGRPTFGVVGCGAVAAGQAGDDEAPCELAVGSPVQEVPGAGGTGRPFGQPIIDVTLGTVGQVALAGAQEGQEGGGGVQADLGVPGGCARRPGGFGSLAGRRRTRQRA